MTDEQRFMEKDHEQAERFKRERDEARERADRLAREQAEVRRTCATLNDWKPMQSRDAGEVFAADAVYDLVAEIRSAALSAAETGGTETDEALALVATLPEPVTALRAFLSAAKTGRQR